MSNPELPGPLIVDTLWHLDAMQARRHGLKQVDYEGLGRLLFGALDATEFVRAELAVRVHIPAGKLDHTLADLTRLELLDVDAAKSKIGTYNARARFRAQTLLRDVCVSHNQTMLGLIARRRSEEPAVVRDKVMQGLARAYNISGTNHAAICAHVAAERHVDRLTAIRDGLDGYAGYLGLRIALQQDLAELVAAY